MVQTLKLSSSLLRMCLAVVVVLIPPIIFEKYTYFLYTIANPNFFNFSGSRLWFDIAWFAAGGAISTIIMGRHRRESVIPPLVASGLFVVAIYVSPFCAIKECYVSSTDGLAPLRDFLLFASLGTVSSASALVTWVSEPPKTRFDFIFQITIATLVGFALSFFPIAHIFAGVSAPLPLNYLQWFLAGAPAGLAASMLLVDRGNVRKGAIVFLSGVAGVLLALILAIGLPCSDCSGYPVTIISILLLTAAFTLPALMLFRRITLLSRRLLPVKGYRKGAGVIATCSIIVSIVLLPSFYFAANYEASVVNGFHDVANSTFSPLEVGRTFVYSAGYLSIPRVTSKAVGINITFGNSTIPSNYPNNFFAAGIGDQSPNCCKDGLDLAYRADAIEFSNGTEAVLARAWWACDTNMACGGYSWQQLLHFGMEDLPPRTLSNWVDLEMNWTASGVVNWFYRVTYSNSTTTGWALFSSFQPPPIQNHYWDAGLFYVGAGNLPTGYAYFYQFGVSSAYPITDGSWHVFMKCPEIVLNGSWTCIPKAAFINGQQSFWKVIYTFGANYPGSNFSYLGGTEVEFFYSTVQKIPASGAPMW
jgi:hypothetical protein